MRLPINGGFGRYSTVYPYTAEMFPTSVRITGVGAGSACSRVGGIATPIVSQGLVKVGFSYPFEAFGALSLIGALMCFICKVCRLDCRECHAAWSEMAAPYCYSIMCLAVWSLS